MMLLDSSFLVAYHNDRDTHHLAAAELMMSFLSGAWGRGLLLEYVFLEVMTVLLARRGLPTANRVGSILLRAAEIDFVAGSELFTDTLETFREQSGAVWSFTDAALVTVARRSSDAYIATFDGDFRGVAGVRVLPA